MKRKIALLLMVMLVATTFAFAEGQQEKVEFPKRSLQLIFPWGPGSSFAASQLVATEWSNQLGQSVIITSTEGAGGVKAQKTVLAKPADGYTIFDGYVAPMVLGPLMGNTDKDWRDFEPLFAVVSNAFGLICRKDETRWNDLPGLIKYIEEHPGELKYSASSDASLPHLVSASFIRNINGIVKHIPYSSMGGDMYKDFAKGELDFVMGNAGVWKTHKDEIKVLAVMSDTPMPDHSLPGPLAKDYGVNIGLHDLSAVGWTWWCVHKDTPAEVVQILRDTLEETLKSQAVIDGINKIGYVLLDPSKYTPENYAKICGQVELELASAIEAIQWEKEAFENFKK